MNRIRPRFAILMDNAFSIFQEGPKLGIDRYAAEAGIDVVYFGLGTMNPEDPPEMAREGLFQFLGPGEFDGLVVISSSLAYSGAERLRGYLEKLKPLPMVTIGQSVLGEDNLIVENAEGIRLIMEHLIRDHGYRSFAYVSGPRRNFEALLRLESYRAALDSAGIAHSQNEEYEGSFLPFSGMEAVSELLDVRGLRPRAIVCANDFMAAGVWEGLLARGISVPHDIAITGFDDIQLSNVLSHQFTTVSQSFDEFGYIAIKRLHAMSRGEPLAGGALVPAKLRIRNSCGCIDFRKRRNRLPQAPGGKAFEELKACVLAFSESGYPAEREEEVLRVWAGIAHRVLDSHGTIYELEEMLLYVRQAIGEGGENGGIDSLSQRMYMLLLEEGSQIVSVEHWVQKYSSMEGRMAIDRLQGELGNDLSLTSHPELFRDIGAQCQADSFHVLRFKNPEAIKQGAEVIYSFRKQADGGACADGPWTPGPGAWLPPGGGSLVANMVLQDSRPFGYILMDAKIADAEVFESMRVRLSIIFTNVEMMRSVRRLNDDMAQEIGIRQESERKLKEALALVEEMAIKDSLTGLVNRRGFLTIAERQVSYLRRHATPYLLLYADLDGLKSINDAWGHKAGDAAIQAAAEVLRGALRDSDIVSRLGGDEFTVLVNMADPLAYDRIKRRIDEGCDAFNLKREKPWILSFSIGRYRAEPGCELSIERMLDLADADMYAQKQKKKNPSGA